MSEYAQSPAAQIKSAIVRHLRGCAGGFSLPIPVEQIRGTLDVSGTPREAYGLVVSVEDLGDHDGWNTGRVLVDVRATITAYTHIEEDADGVLCDSLAAETLEAMQGIQYNLNGWLVHYNGNWGASDVSMDGAYRSITLAATLPLNYIGDSQ